MCTPDSEEASEWEGQPSITHPPLYWADLAVCFQLRLRLWGECVFVLYTGKKKKNKREGPEWTWRVKCTVLFLCSPQSRTWAEMQPRGHQLSQVARGNSTSCLETDPLISLALPSISQSAHLSYLLFFLSSLSFLPNRCLQTGSLLLSLRIKVGTGSLIYGVVPPRQQWGICWPQ